MPSGPDCWMASAIPTYCVLVPFRGFSAFRQNNEGYGEEHEGDGVLVPFRGFSAFRRSLPKPIYDAIVACLSPLPRIQCLPAHEIEQSGVQDWESVS